MTMGDDDYVVLGNTRKNPPPRALPKQTNLQGVDILIRIISEMFFWMNDTLQPFAQQRHLEG